MSPRHREQPTERSLTFVSQEEEEEEEEEFFFFLFFSVSYVYNCGSQNGPHK
jgi:hypothetical protein